MPFFVTPTVPNAMPTSQTASPQPLTIFSDPVRPRVRGEVEVAGAPAEQRVAHAAADEVQAVPRPGEPLGQLVGHGARAASAPPPRSPCATTSFTKIPLTFRCDYYRHRRTGHGEPAYRGNRLL